MSMRAPRNRIARRTTGTIMRCDMVPRLIEPLVWDAPGSDGEEGAPPPNAREALEIVEDAWEVDGEGVDESRWTVALKIAICCVPFKTKDGAMNAE